MARFAPALCALFILVLLASCGGAKRVSRPAAVGIVGAPSLTAQHAPATAAEARPQPAPSHPIGTLTEKSLGPFAAVAGDHGLAAWIAPSEQGEEHDLIAVPLAGDGAPVGQVRVVAHVPREVTSLVVEAAGGPDGGWLLVWTALLDRGESVSVIGLAADGTPHGDPSDLQRTSDHVKWAGIAPLSAGAICVWAEETARGSANMLAVALGAEGKPRGLPMRVAAVVERWQVVVAGDGAALALVRPAKNGDGPPVPELTWQRLNADGSPRGAPAFIARGATLGSDVDVVARKDGWLLAWTDRTQQDAQVIFASVDASGHVAGPTPAMNAAGASALVGLASGPAGLGLAWQEPGRRTRENRTLHLALVPATGPLAAEPVTSIEIAQGTTPEFVATGDGFALLESARACEATSGSCAGPTVPTFVRFGARLEPMQTEPFLIGGDHDPAALGWGLVCGGTDRCFALAASGKSPTVVYTVALAARRSPFAAPLPPLPPTDSPSVTGIATIASGEAYDDVAAARIGDASVVATLTSDHTHAGRRIRGGRIAIRSVDAAGQPLFEPTWVTSHALPTGGIAMAPGPTAKDGAALAWVRQDGDESYVQVVRVDARGKTEHELRLTSGSGEVSNVAIAWAGDGWLVAWVDTRDHNGEVYVAKVDHNLRRIGKDERITHAPGDASDVALAVRGTTAWIAWSDPRDTPHEGTGDIFATTLHATDGTPAGAEVRILATARNSRSPELAVIDPGGVLVTWIEDVPTGLEGPSAAIVARLDKTAHVIGTPKELSLAGEGRPTAIALVALRSSASVESAEAVVARSGPGGVTLDAIRLGADGEPIVHAWPLIDLDAPAAFDVALAVTEDSVLFDDVATDRRVRRATVKWLR